MALAALERREDVPEAWADAAIRGLPRPSNCEDAFQLRAIARHASGPVIGRVLARYEGISAEYVVDFVRRRLDGGETVTAESFEGNVTAAQADDVAAFLDRFGADMGTEVRAAFDEWRRSSSSARSGASGSGRSTGPPLFSPAGGASSST